MNFTPQLSWAFYRLLCWTFLSGDDGLRSLNFMDSFRDLCRQNGELCVHLISWIPSETSVGTRQNGGLCVHLIFMDSFRDLCVAEWGTTRRTSRTSWRPWSPSTPRRSPLSGTRHTGHPQQQTVLTGKRNYLSQCCGSRSVLDPYSAALWIRRIRIRIHTFKYRIK